MGLFSKKDDVSLNVLSPDGSSPSFNGQEGFNQFLEKLTITPESYDGNASILKNDQNAYTDATSALTVLGTNSGQEKIYSYGPMTIKSLPGINTGMEAIGVATENYLIVRFAYGRGLNYFMAPFDEITGINSAGPMSADFTFRNSIYIDKKGRTHLQNHSVSLSSRIGKDGHENRRALSIWYTTAEMLKRQFTSDT